MVAVMLQNPRVSSSHLDSVRPLSHLLLVALVDWESPFSLRALRIHIVRRSRAPAAPHPFLGHPWCERDLDGGIPWGVVATASITHLLLALREQEVEEELRCPRYLIGATVEGAA